MAESDLSSLQSYSSEYISEEYVSERPLLDILEPAGTARIEPLKKHRPRLFETPEIKCPSSSFIEKALPSKNKYNLAGINSTPVLPNWRRALAVSSDECSPISRELYKNEIPEFQNNKKTLKKSNKSYLVPNKASNRSKVDNFSVLSTRNENGSIRENGSISRNVSYKSNNKVNSGELLENSSDSHENNDHAITNQHQSIKPNSFKTSVLRNSKREVSSANVNNYLKRNISKSIKSNCSTKFTTPTRKSLNECVNNLHEKKNMEVQTSFSRYNESDHLSSPPKTKQLERKLFLSLQNGPLIDSMDSDADYNVLRKPSIEVGWRIPSTSRHNNTTSLCYDKFSKESNKNRHYNDKKSLKMYRNLRRNYKQKDSFPSKSTTEHSYFHRSKCNNPDEEIDNSSIYDEEDFIPNKTSKFGTANMSVLKRSILSNNNGQDHEMEDSSTDEEFNDALNANMFPKSTSKLTNDNTSLCKKGKLINNDPDQEMENSNTDEDDNEYSMVNAVPKSTSKLRIGKKSIQRQSNVLNDEEPDSLNYESAHHSKQNVSMSERRKTSRLETLCEDNEKLGIASPSKTTSKKLKQSRVLQHNLTNNVLLQEEENFNTDEDDSEFINVNAAPKSTLKLSNCRKSVYKEGIQTNNDSKMETSSHGRTSVREKTNLINKDPDQEMENLNADEDDNEYSNINAVPKSTSKRRIDKKSMQRRSNVSNDKEPDSSSRLETLCEEDNEHLAIAGPSKTTSKKIKQSRVRKTFDGINLALPELITTTGRPVRNRRPPPLKIYEDIFQFVCSGKNFSQVNILKKDETYLLKNTDIKKGNKAKPKKSVTKTNKIKSKSLKISDETTENPTTPENDLNSGVVVHYDTNDGMTTNLQANEETDFGYNTDSAKNLQLSNLTNGNSFIKLKPREMIPYPAVKSSCLVLIVRTGHGTITINNTQIKIKQFESFELPHGDNYAIRNDSRKDILIIDVVNV